MELGHLVPELGGHYNEVRWVAGLKSDHYIVEVLL